MTTSFIRMIKSADRNRSIFSIKAGFSLIEVMLALGVVSFAMITSVGLLPEVLKTYRDTKQDTTHANIVQFITSNANMSPFSNLATSFNGKTWQFDDDGQLLQNQSNATVSYTVYTTGTTPPALPNGTPSSNTLDLEIQIQDANAPSGMVSIYHVLIANQGF